MTQLIFTQLVGEVHHGPEKKQVQFGADQFNIAKKPFFLYWVWWRFADFEFEFRMIPTYLERKQLLFH